MWTGSLSVLSGNVGVCGIVCHTHPFVQNLFPVWLVILLFWNTFQRHKALFRFLRRVNVQFEIIMQQLQ